MLSSTHRLSLYIKLMTVLNKEDWYTKLMTVLNKEDWQSMK